MKKTVSTAISPYWLRPSDEIHSARLAGRPVKLIALVR